MLYFCFFFSNILQSYYPQLFVLIDYKYLQCFDNEASQFISFISIIAVSSIISHFFGSSSDIIRIYTSVIDQGQQIYHQRSNLLGIN